jgi:pyruvate formate lyase activating enzyme
MIGRRMSVDEVMAEVLRDRIFYDDSGGGVTFSGGEPLLQFGFLRALLLACRREEIHTAVDTCGYAPLEELLAIAPLVDLFLYDVKAIDNRLHIQHAGVSNDLILGNLRRLGWAHENLWVRVPVVPGFNDDEDELQAIARLAAEIPGVRKVELLPYHQTGGHKRAALRVPLPRQAEDLPRPT